MMRRCGSEGLVEGWRRWLLALTLCVFAVAYGAPTSFAAPSSHAGMGAGCHEAGKQVSHGAPEPHATGVSACCIAHCLPAAPVFLPSAPDGRAAGEPERTRLDESGEGFSPPVPLPPPRPSDRA